MKANHEYAVAREAAIRAAVSVTLSQLVAGSLAVDEAETVLLQVIAPPTVTGMEAVAEVVEDVAKGKMNIPEALDWLL